MSQTFPTDWREQPCFVVAIPKPLIPYVGGLLKILEQRGFWATADDYERGYTATVELEGCLVATCLDVLLTKQDALYRMLDTALYGKVYEVVSTDPLVIEPGIPDVHEAIFQTGFGIMDQIDRVTQLIDNSINGTETPYYTYDPSVKALLQGVIDALGAEDTDLADILSQLELIATLVA